MNILVVFFVDRKPWVPRCSASLRCLITVRLGITTTTHAAITPRTRYAHVEITASTYTCRSLSESSSQLKFSICPPPPLPPKHSTPPHYCITHFICNSAVKIDLFLHATTCSLCAVMLPIYWGYRNNNINGSKYEILIVWYSRMQSALFFISKKLMQHNEFFIHTVFYIVLHR